MATIIFFWLGLSLSASHKRKKGGFQLRAKLSHYITLFFKIFMAGQLQGSRLIYNKIVLQ